MATKEERIRGYTSDLKALKDLPPSAKVLEDLEVKWDLVPDDYNQIKKMASGHGSRYMRALDDGDWDKAAEEALSGLALVASDPEVLRDWLETLVETPPPADKKSLFTPLSQTYSRLELKSEDRAWVKKNFPGIKTKSPKGKFRLPSQKTLTIIGAVLSVGILSLIIYFLVIPLFFKAPPPVAPTARTKGLEVTFDPRGQKAEFLIERSEMQLFEEKTFYQIQGKVFFPKDTIGRLQAEVVLSDKEGKVLSTDPIELLGIGAAPLPPGAGVSLTYQKDISEIYNTLTDVTVRLTDTKAAQLTAPEKAALAFEATSALPPGMALDLGVLQDQWTKGLSQYTHRLDLLVTNKGQRPIKELTLEAWWKSPKEELYRKTIRVLSEFVPTLGPGQGTSFRVSQEFSLDTWELPAGTWPEFHIAVKEIQ